MINTGCLPRNAPNTIVSIKDLLLPAHDAFFGFPIFKRFYSGNLSNFALSLFLGKPAILVEHHDYFHSGVGPIEAFVRKLREISPRVRWRRLETVVVDTHVRKKTSPATIDVRFFANRFKFESEGTDARSVRLRKRIHDRSALRGVRVDGAEIEWGWEGEFAVLQLDSPGSGSHEIEIEMAPTLPRRAYSFSPWYQGGVAARRALSELRDNVISRNPQALNMAQSIARTLGLRAGAPKR